jgi:hypothetical protein
MNIGLVIVDAYSDRFDNLEFKSPTWSDETKKNVKHFSEFLTYVCDYERAHGTTIIHSFGNDSKELYNMGQENVGKASQLKLGEGDIIATSENLADVIISKKLNVVFYGGFHFGKCIHSHSNRTYQNLRKRGRGDINNLNLVLNLSMTNFNHSWKHHLYGKRGWDINLDNKDVRTEYKNSVFSNLEFLPTHITSKNAAVLEVFTEVNYNHHMWSVNGFEEINIRTR